MRAISIKEPYASLIRSGKKTIETRSWYTKIRGSLLLCASMKPEGKFAGYAFATAVLVDVRLMDDKDCKKACCDFVPGWYSWILEDIKPIVPFPVKGKRGFYYIDYKSK